MTAEEIRKEKLLKTIPFVRGNIIDVLPDSLFRSICERWTPEINNIDVNGMLFIEHGYECGYIADFLTNELIWATENGDKNIEISQQRKWNLLYTLECLSLCHVSNVLTWTVTENGVVPQIETTSWRKGPDRNWYDCDIEPIDSYNLNEKLDVLKIPRYPRYTDDPSRYFNTQDPAWIGIAMSESLGDSSGLKERISILGDTLPIRPFNDRGVGKWGGIPTFTTPFESDAPSLSDSPLISHIEYSDETVKAALKVFVSKKQEIEEMYGFIIDSLVDFVDEKVAPRSIPWNPGNNGSKESKERYERESLEYKKADKCRRFASFYRFADMDLWKNFDYIMKTYRVQDESQYNIPSENNGQKGSFCKIDASECQPKVGDQMIRLANPLELHVNGVDTELDPTICRDFVHEVKVSNENDNNYDTKVAPLIWETFNEQKRIIIRDLAIKTLADVNRQYDDMKAELIAAEKCLANNTLTMQSFETARLAEGISLNSRIPTQRFMKPDALIPLNPKDVNITFSEEAMGAAVGKMIRAGQDRAGKMIKSDFSMKEQEDHLRGAALSLHTIVCMAVDAVEGRSVLEDWSADIYSSIAEHSVNDAMLPRDRNSDAFKEIVKDPKKMKNHRFVNFSKVREGTKALRYGEIPGKDEITTFGEWNQIEQMIPSPNFKPFIERADGLSMRELIKHGLTGTPLQSGLTRDNARYVMAPRITKWRLRSSLQKIAKDIRHKTLNSNSQVLLSHLNDLERLSEARKGILDFVLNFCDSFAKDAHKTKMDIFNDPATKDAMEQTDDLSTRQKMLKIASETWQLSSSGLYIRQFGNKSNDEHLFYAARDFIKGENGKDIFKDSVAAKTNLSVLIAYSGELNIIPKAVRLGLLPNDQYLSSNIDILKYLLPSIDDTPQCFGNMMAENSQYMPLLKGLAFAQNPYTGNWQHSLNLENRDLNRMQLYMKYFSKANGPNSIIGSKADKWSLFAALPMGIDKTGYDSKDRLYEIVVDNMMRLAWNGDNAVRAARAFHSMSEYYIAGCHDSSGIGHGSWIQGDFDWDAGPYAKNPFVIEKGSIKAGKAHEYTDSFSKEMSDKYKFAQFIKVPTPLEEKLEYITAYTLTPFTKELYLEKNRILKYSPLNQDYAFITTYAPVRRENLGILVRQHGIDQSEEHFGLLAYGCGRGMDAIRKNEIDEKQRYLYENQIPLIGSYNKDVQYVGETPLLPSDFLLKEALDTIRSDKTLSSEFSRLRQTLVPECIIARTGNNREDRSMESARMHCLMQDIGYTVRQMRECNPELPKTVMSTAAMDPLARLGEPEITEVIKTDSEREAELQSSLRKAYWGEDLHNIRRHLSTANRKFYEQHVTGGTQTGKLSARYAYQYEFLQNVEFLELRYAAGKGLMQQPLNNNANDEIKDWGWHYFKAIHQNCASVNVKGILRDYFADLNYKERPGFDSTNLLRNMAFKPGNLLDDQNRQETLLHYPGSVNYPKYKYGMEFYRENIPYGEFVGWTYNKFSKDSYDIHANIESFFKGTKDNSKCVNNTDYTAKFNKYYETVSATNGIRGIKQNKCQTEGLNNMEDKMLIAPFGDKKPYTVSQDDFILNKKNIEKKIRSEYLLNMDSKLNYEYIYSLRQIEGLIKEDSVPFLYQAINSDFTKNLFMSDIKNKEQRSDYFPSVDEISVLSDAFISGFTSYCKDMNIETGPDKQHEEAVRVLTENPPDWIDL